MRVLLRRSHRRATALFLLVAVLLAGGVLAARRLPSAIFPAVTFPIVKIIADAGEEPAARMIPEVTRPLEEAVRRVPGIRSVRSITSRGSSELTANFAWGTDMQVALQRVEASLERTRGELPEGTRIDAEWMNTLIFPILGYSLTSESRSEWELRQLAEFGLKPELARIPGVARVEVQGGREREFQIRLDPRALAGRHLSGADVVEAVRSSNQILSAGLVERQHELYLALVDGRARDLAELGAVAVPIPGGVPARLDELGTLAAADAVSFVRTSADGRPAVLVNLVQQPTANTLAIAAAVERLFAERPQLVPRDVRWTKFYDQASFVAASVDGARDAILIGVVLAAVVLLAFLRNLRLAAIAVAAIPASVALVFLGLAAAGQTINLMTLGGIAAAIGLVADDAIVVVENIHRHRETAASDEPTQSGIADILPALVGSSLSTLVVFLPFAFLPGVAGAFFKPLALTMSIALVASFLLAVLIVPAAVRRAEHRRPLATPLDAPPPRLFDRLVRFALRHGALAALGFVALLGGGWLCFRALGSDFLPEMDEGTIILDYFSPPGTSLTDTDRMLAVAEREILAVPDVATYSRRTGTQLGFFITEPNTGDYAIQLKPRRARRPVEEVIEELRERIARVEPALTTDFGQLLEDDIGDLTGGAPQPIAVELFGEDQALLADTARRAAGILRGVDGVEDVFDGITISGPALVIRPRPEELTRHGVTTAALHATVELATTGAVASDLRIGERVHPIRVFSQHETSPAALKVAAADGKLLQIGTLATVTTEPPEAEIDRADLQTFLGVTARLSGRNLGDTIADVRRALDAGLRLPPGISLRFGGLYAEQQTSFLGLLGVLGAALLLVSVVVLFEFGDWRAPLAIALLAAGVLAGVFAALAATGMTLNISSFVGAILMVGIVGENAIFVIHDAREAMVGGAAVEDAWAGAARRRLRPVGMTTLASVFALAPLALALGSGAQLLQPLAVAVIGGFALSGPLVLVALPALYRALDPKGKLATHHEAFGN
jgi:CzcA family heavy metal efflux pump